MADKTETGKQVEKGSGKPGEFGSKPDRVPVVYQGRTLMLSIN